MPQTEYKCLACGIPMESPYEFCGLCGRKLTQVVVEAPVAVSRRQSPDVASLVIRDVAELPNRTSPEDWPEAMLVTAEELENILRARLSAAREGASS